MRAPIRLTLGALLLLPLLGAAGVYLRSESVLRDVPTIPAFTTPIPDDSASLAHGEHLVRTRGCFGCHGQQLEGRVFEDWGVDRAVAVNLAKHARAHEPAVLEAAIRHGVGHDGRALWSMPSYNFVHLADADVAAIIAYLRSAPVVEHDLPAARLGWRTRWSIVTEADGDMPAWVAQVPALVVGPDEPDAVRRGERLAMTSCNECHGLDLRGSTMEPDSRPPDLAIVAGYPWKAFQRLMREGIPLDGRDLGLMAMVAKDRFADWTPGEVADLYAFLQTLPRRPVPTGVFWRPGA